jgi:gluconokinase
MKPNPAALIHLFGLTGAGKTFIANFLRDKYGYFVYEADRDFAPRMWEANRRGETFTDEMRDEFYEIVAGRFLGLSKIHPLLVMPQAGYRRKHREFLRKQIPGLLQVLVIAEEHLVEERIIKRGNEVTVAYAQRVRAFFEEPPSDTPRLYNNAGTASLQKQFEALS